MGSQTSGLDAAAAGLNDRSASALNGELTQIQRQMILANKKLWKFLYVPIMKWNDDFAGVNKSYSLPGGIRSFISNRRSFYTGIKPESIPEPIKVIVLCFNKQTGESFRWATRDVVYNSDGSFTAILP